MMLRTAMKAMVMGRRSQMIMEKVDEKWGRITKLKENYAKVTQQTPPSK
jgi:hypothetical protein